jgi:NADPH:quinone reductase-like Zn-dependent oxidoreductase
VLATTSSPAEAEQLEALGASQVVNYTEEPEWGKRVRVLTGGRGVDRVVEVGGPSTIGQSLRAVAAGGEIASIGFLSEEKPGIDFLQLKASGDLPQHRRGATARTWAYGVRARGGRRVQRFWRGRRLGSRERTPASAQRDSVSRPG